MENYRQIVGKFNWYLFLLVAFTLSFSPVIVRVVWTVWLISWFLELRFLDRKNFAISKYQIPAFLLLMFFVWQLLSYLWTIDKVTAGVVLERQVSYLFLPIIMMFGVNRNYDVKKSIVSFIIGSAVISVFYIYGILVFSNHTSISNSDYSSILENIRFDNFIKYFPGYFGRVRHHAFFSNVLIIASIFLLFIYDDIKNLVGKKITFVLTFTYLIINGFFFFYLVDSRASIVTILILLFVAVLRYAIQGKKWIFLLLSLIVVLVSFVLIFSFHPRFRNIESSKLVDIERVENNDDARLKIWSTALKHINEYVFTGEGVGSSKLFLEQKNREDNVFDESFIERKYHSHNQYIETTIEMGIFALLLFISVFVLQIYISTSTTKKIGFYIAVCFAVKCGFECMFRSDDVVILLCFIMLILYWLNKRKEKEI